MIYDPQKHHRRSIRLKGYDYTQAGAYFITLVTHGRECLFGEVVNGEMVLNEWGFLALNEWRQLGQRFAQVIVDETVVMPNHLHGILLIRDDGQPAVATGRPEPDTVVVGSDHDHGEVGFDCDDVGVGQSDCHNVGVGPDCDHGGAGQEATLQTTPDFFAPPLLPLPHAPPQHNHPPGVIPGSLGAIVGAYKSTTARLINGLRRTIGAPVWQRNYYERIVRDELELGRIRRYILENPRHWIEDRANPGKPG